MGLSWVSKQEQFIEKICNQVDSNINFVGIGGVFDWVAGAKKKAPEWLANIGLEVATKASSGSKTTV